MPTIKLLPSTYYLSNTQYLSISNADNMYTDTDSDTYATVTNSRTSTTSYYIYLRGFNFDSVPANAEINSYTIRIKLRESGGSTSSSYAPVLAGGTSTYSTMSCPAMSTTATVLTFTGTATWESISSYGEDLGIRVNCRRNNRNTTSHIYIYGAEIEVDYTIPDPRTVTTSLIGDGTIVPEGVTDTTLDSTFELTITPTNKSDTVKVTNNGTDVSDQLVPVYPGGDYTSVPESYTTGGSISSGSSYLSYPVGYTAEDPHTYSSNVYASSGSTGYAIYSFDFSEIPENATIQSVEVKCCGKRESSTTDSTHVSKVGLYTGTTLKGEEENFTSTSEQVITVSDPGTWTRSELQDAKLRFTVGYYGGGLFGVTWKVTVSVPSTGPDHYLYTYTVSVNAVIVVTIGAEETSALYFKRNGSWVKATVAYKKVNGVWVEQSDLTTVFQSGVNYVCGD